MRVVGEEDQIAKSKISQFVVDISSVIFSIFLQNCDFFFLSFVALTKKFSFSFKFCLWIVCKQLCEWIGWLETHKTCKKSARVFQSFEFCSSTWNWRNQISVQSLPVVGLGDSARIQKLYFWSFLFWHMYELGFHLKISASPNTNQIFSKEFQFLTKLPSWGFAYFERHRRRSKMKTLQTYFFVSGDFLLLVQC